MSDDLKLFHVRLTDIQCRFLLECIFKTGYVCNRVIFFTALLLGTLRTYQRAGCDNDIVTLKCPAGTSIAVQIAQYGKSASSKGLCSKLTSTATSRYPEVSDSTVCLLPNTIQVGIIYLISTSCTSHKRAFQ